MSEQGDELEPITGADVGVLIHLIGSLQMADYTLAVKQTMYELALRGPARRMDALRLASEVDMCRLDAEASAGAVTDWLATHLPPPICPDGSCLERHRRLYGEG